MFRRSSCSDQGGFWGRFGDPRREGDKGWKGEGGLEGEGGPGLALAEGSKGRWKSLGKPCTSCQSKTNESTRAIYPEDTILRYLGPGGGGGAEDSVGDAVDTGLRVQRGVGGRAGEAVALAGVHRGVGGERGHQAGHPLAPWGSDPPGGGEARLYDASLLLRCGAPLLRGGARARPADGGELTWEYGARPWTWRERRFKAPGQTGERTQGGRRSSVPVVWVLVGVPVMVLRRLRLQ